MGRRNPVAKHGRRFNRGGPHQDKRRAAMLDPEYEMDEDFYGHEAVDDDNTNTCPHCGSENHEHESLMGALGSIEHHRCRYCGMSFERIAE